MALYESYRNDEHPSPTDLLKFNVHIRYYLDNTNHIHYESFYLPTIVCKKFFSPEGHDFLRTHLSEDPIFTSDTLDRLIIQITYEAQRSYNIDYYDIVDDVEVEKHNSGNSQPREFRMNLELEIHEEEFEEELYEEFGMVPASKDAVETTMKTFDLNVTKKSEILCCAICMDEFDRGNTSNDIGTSSIRTMPCNHLFHHQCIVRWLQTSHTCPLCRYPMLTTALAS